jgi:hypothetical protein
MLCPDDLAVHSAGAESDVVYCATAAKAVVLPRALRRSYLDQWTTFRSVDVGADSGPLMGQLLSSGLLMRREDVLERLRSRSDCISAPARVDALGILTCDRPGCLRTALSSYAHNLKAWGHRAEIVIVDDSRTADAQAANRDLASRAARDMSACVRYIGEREVGRLVRDLARRTDVPEAVIRFGLSRGERAESYGVARNILQLVTHGSAIVSVDDDTLGEFWQPADRTGGPVFGTLPDAFEVEFFADSALSAENVSGEPVDLLGAHARLLGCPLSSVLGPFASEQIEFGVMTQRLFRALRTDAASAIIATSLGVVGDSGLGGPHWHLLLKGRSHQNLTRNHERYRIASESRQVRRCVGRPTIVGGEFWMGYCAGLDHRRVWPPFPPVGRNEDGVFMNFAMALYPTDFAAHLPIAVAHRPPGGRRDRREDMSVAMAQVRTCDVVSGILSKIGNDIHMQSAADRLRAMGVAMQDLACLSDTELHELVRGQIWGIFRQRTSVLEELLVEYHAGPTYWTADVAGQLDGIRRTLERGIGAESVRGDGAPGAGEVVGSPDRFRAFLRDFGLLAYSWPSLLEAAAEWERTR